MISVAVSALVTIEALGSEQDWQFGGQQVFWNEAIAPNGAIILDGPPEGEYAQLTGCAAAVLDAVIPEGSSCRVTLNNYSDAGRIAYSLRGGEPVLFEFENGGGEVSHDVVAGDGSGQRLTCASDQSQTSINAIMIRTNAA